VRNALVFILIVVFLASNQVWAVPVDSPPEQDIHKGDVAAVNTAQGPASAKIPDRTVEMFIRSGPNSRFEIFFLDVKYDYDLVDYEFYNAWCLEEGKPIRRDAIHKVRLYNCYDPDLPPQFADMEWNKINYTINHKDESKKVTQEAIWYFAGTKRTPLSPEANQFIEEVNLKGKDYKPAEGELQAVICAPQERKQPVFLEFKIPPAPLEVSSVAMPPLAATGSSFASWFPFLPLLGIIPFFTGGDSPKHPPPPHHHTVPEPSSMLLLGCGVAGLIAYRKFSKKRKR